MKRLILISTFFVFLFTLIVPFLYAQEHGGAAPPTQKEEKNPWVSAMLGLSAAIVVGASAFASAWAQSKIGSAAAGAIAEKPEVGGLMIVLEAIPETMIILGFVIAIMIVGKL